MSKILIENYRGFDIEFQPQNEKFLCIITDELLKESISFSAIKKFIDEYKKKNQSFISFYIELIPSENWGYEYEKKKIIGIRKDGRFITEDSNGAKGQLSDWDMKDYMIHIPENERAFCQFHELKLKEQKQESEIIEQRRIILSTMKIIKLSDYIETL